ncbi:ABC transporter ATP-binding protein [Pelagibius litoralis]|uniref:ABC transporter ATP-binding protein n=2 Tax=Pelagibius litoralis TaxID=374515 RepID=A0A967EXS6_9PROT|nr:ABC transporter ATP-binding protein [Pelagibius litoralis]
MDSDPTISGENLPVLRLQNISRTFGSGRIVAVDDLSLDVYPGEIVSILGPSGCGKTTTMRLIAGLDEPTGGDIEVFGKSVNGQPPHRRNIGLVFQSLAIFPHMSVHKNVAFGLRMKGVERRTIDQKVEEVLDLVHLPAAEYGARMPSQLSGGQLQRVALARTLATEPSLVLFDEPMAALDRRLRDYMAVELRSIQKSLNVAAVYVTHDQETASAMSDRIVIMEAGKVVQVGTPEEVYERPGNRFVATFLGDMNFLEAGSVGVWSDGSRTVHIADGSLVVADEISGRREGGSVMVRPEHVELMTLEPNGPGLSGRISETQFSSGFYRSRICLSDGQEVLTRSTENTAVVCGVGAKIWLKIKQGRARMLRS